jgi:hypothetical protein
MGLLLAGYTPMNILYSLRLKHREFSASVHDSHLRALVSSFSRWRAAEDEPKKYTCSGTHRAVAEAVGSVSQWPPGTDEEHLFTLKQ